MRDALIALFTMLGVASVTSYAGETGQVPFNLPAHGRLVLIAPVDWTVEVHPSAGNSPPTLEFRQKSGATFHVFLTPMWTASTDTPFPDDASVQAKVGAAAKQLEIQSVEHPLLVKELVGTANRGYYFMATDRAPKPEEWKYLTQGVIRIGPVDLAFSILTNEGQESVVKSALSMLSTASHVPI
jgi:hypothetical protein